ncbi:hypothetical protein I304_06361 [Cryptococcus deuterogattii CBS 10090]|nr:hypothetical protein I304_06361 [Cryptococcus deuterogattii CBS 10090]
MNLLYPGPLWNLPLPLYQRRLWCPPRRHESAIPWSTLEPASTIVPAATLVPASTRASHESAIPWSTLEPASTIVPAATLVPASTNVPALEANV